MKWLVTLLQHTGSRAWISSAPGYLMCRPSSKDLLPPARIYLLKVQLTSFPPAPYSFPPSLLSPLLIPPPLPLFRPLLLKLHLYILPAYMSVQLAYLLCSVTRREHQIPWNWSCKWLWPSRGMLRVWHRFSRRGPNDSDLWIISTAPI